MKFRTALFSFGTVAFTVTGVFVAPAAVVYADDTVTQENINTGALSLNKNKVKVEREGRTVKKTTAKVKNVVTGIATTGGNKAKHNTGGGDVTSGDVDGTVDLTNTVNEGTNGECCCGADQAAAADVDQTNRRTGARSHNINKAKISDTQVCKDITKAKVKNDVYLNGDTGGNKAIGNTSGGTVDSGDITFTVTVANTVN